ncbi:conserved hypothetical protein [Thermoanaerobacter mathranii subsp. mathranii str. A3]|jgi:hypothetical protein|uniref:DUF3787 domain-containing protein n=1 Tax=Thermoanaerobacter mathranii subsp. mathranii (strain DSM 11426 / CCUG 53645 / CIP 108742 / A3) TaxID=583358 RepID=A0ABN3Z851_THEM3|nr:MULTISPECIES: DUF3787 domain-containing protein [Thermoanaerobacter]ADH61704.1 conserved hypothetical protein [Thermoanaerobacter mathranii subsp. mathranii str. A3]MBT1278661.1 DUF3787 domain-containing protein [Thermoanaerobacter sp. CM-CNRG TB177]
MTKKPIKLKKLPIENHKTASWANIQKLKDESNVPIPSENEVINAKEWVEENQK